MKSILTIVSMFLTGWAVAQISFNTGSPDLDADLNSINTTARADLSTFKSETSISFGIPIASIDDMLGINMEPAEVYLALEISKISGTPINKVVDSYKSNKGKGWGVIAKEMGIKPGSDEFHALKGNCSKKKDKGNNGNKGNNKGKGNK